MFAPSGKRKSCTGRQLTVSKVARRSWHRKIPLPTACEPTPLVSNSLGETTSAGMCVQAEIRLLPAGSTSLQSIREGKYLVLMGPQRAGWRGGRGSGPTNTGATSLPHLLSSPQQEATEQAAGANSVGVERVRARKSPHFSHNVGNFVVVLDFFFSWFSNSRHSLKGGTFTTNLEPAHCLFYHIFYFCQSFHPTS